MPKAPKVVGAVLVVLLIAFALPTLIASPDENKQQTIRLIEKNTTVLSEDTVAVHLDEPNASTDLATVTVIDQQNGTQITKDIAEGSSDTFAFAEGDVNVSVLTITTDAADLRIEHARTYGWGGPETEIVEHIGLVLTAMAVIIVVSFAAMMAVKTTWP
jgi:hypothetical protein